MSRALGGRRGAALATVLGALTVMAAIAAGAVAASRAAQRTHRARLPEVRAASAVDGALAETIARWPAAWRQLAVGATDSVRVDGVSRHATRLDAWHVLVEARATMRAGAPGIVAARTASIVARLDPPMPAALGAATVGGSLRVASGASIAGVDVTPAGWPSCSGARVDSAALVVASSDSVIVDLGAAVGVPRVDARVGDPAGYATFAGETWAALLARAAVALAPGTRSPNATESAGVCVLGPESWSDPSHAMASCADTYALVVARGPLTIGGSAHGQGMLLVDGDLTIDGSLDFAGVIVVRGALHAATLRLDGALLVAGGASRSVLGSGSRLRWSRCAVTRAVDGVARISLLRRRSWVEVTR